LGGVEGILESILDGDVIKAANRSLHFLKLLIPRIVIVVPGVNLESV
jgi:hypothetical protein